MTEWEEVVIPTHPLDDGEAWVKVVAVIRKNATGELHEYECNEIMEWKFGTPSTWIWTEGNYSCDCNRGIFFGEPEDVDCGDGAYAVQLRNAKTGEVYYDELDSIRTGGQSETGTPSRLESSRTE